MNDTTPDELGLTLERFVDWARQQGWRYRGISNTCGASLSAGV